MKSDPNPPLGNGLKIRVWLTRFSRLVVQGQPEMARAVLLILVANGPMPRTREHTLLAREVGVPDQVGFVNSVTAVRSVEQFNRQRDRAIAGPNVDVLLRGFKSDQISRGHGGSAG